MLYKSKKSQIVVDVFLFIFASFMYFTVGYTFLNAIIIAVIDANSYTGLMYYLIKTVPFLPIAGLVYWGYKLAQGETLIAPDNGEYLQ